MCVCVWEREWERKQTRRVCTRCVCACVSVYKNRVNAFEYNITIRYVPPSSSLSSLPSSSSRWRGAAGCSPSPYSRLLRSGLHSRLPSPLPLLPPSWSIRTTAAGPFTCRMCTATVRRRGGGVGGNAWTPKVCCNRLSESFLKKNFYFKNFTTPTVNPWENG